MPTRLELLESYDKDLLDIVEAICKAHNNITQPEFYAENPGELNSPPKYEELFKNVSNKNLHIAMLNIFKEQVQCMRQITLYNAALERGANIEVREYSPEIWNDYKTYFHTIINKWLK